jgi:hypothetical protein
VKKLFVLVAAVALILAASCDTKNIGTDPGPSKGPVIASVTFAPAQADRLGGVTGTVTVAWASGTGPYTISMDFGGGATPNVPAGTPATSPYTANVTYVNGTDADVTYNYSVVVTDSVPQSGSNSGTFVVGPTGNTPPTIDNVAYAGGVLTVDVSDADGDDVTVTVTEPAGLMADATSKVAAGGTATFNWSASDIIAGGSGSTDITADDGNGGTDTDSATITIDPINIPDGALAAVPAMTAATTADVVTVVVISGAFSNPFQYMNGAGVTVNSGAAFEDGTLNVGVPGGGQMDPDGVWTAVDPDSFLLPNDFMIQENDIGGGMVRIDFNVTPIGGSETSTGGALFNFGLNFGSAGTYDLGFQEFQDVKRTYYSDGASTEYNWDDISNNYTGVPNSINVT